jgi:class 3 adenylate cyclase
VFVGRTVLDTAVVMVDQPDRELDTEILVAQRLERGIRRWGDHDTKLLTKLTGDCGREGLTGLDVASRKIPHVRVPGAIGAPVTEQDPLPATEHGRDTDLGSSIHVLSIPQRRAASTAAAATAPATSTASVLRVARLRMNAPSSPLNIEIASSRAFAGAIPASVRRSVAALIQLSKTSAVAARRRSLVLATSTATVAMGQDSLFFAGDTGPLLDTIEEFVTGRLPRHGVDRVLATVLFTDVVSSTDQIAGMGDRRWSELLATHDGLTRSELERFRGREIQTIGDGFLATFDGPGRAVRCACAIRDVVRAIGIHVRVGLHTGEIDLHGDDFGGIAVHIAQRVQALAQPNEVLVSRTVTELVGGSGIPFADRGTHALKGVPNQWQLFAVEDSSLGSAPAGEPVG